MTNFVQKIVAGSEKVALEDAENALAPVSLEYPANITIHNRIPRPI